MSKINEIKIRLEGLQVGMYVSRTDRAWADLPIQLEGVIITDNSQIDMLTKYCSSIYIDQSKGRSANSMYWIIDNPDIITAPVMDIGANEYALLRKENYEIINSLDDELSTAKEVIEQVKFQVYKTFNDINHNKEIVIKDLKEAISQTVNSILRNPTAIKFVMEIQKSDQYNYNHALVTSVWCTQFGRHLGLEKKDIEELALGGLIMDIGKTKIPTELLTKKEGLTSDEINMLRSHVDFSVQLLVNCEGLSHNIMRMVASHHERFDGSGYPLGVKDKDIPLYGCIAGIVDSFDAMTSKQPFSPLILPPHEAIKILYDSRGKLFQTELVEQFIQTIGLYPTGTLVELSSGEVAVVTAISGLKRLRPTVILILDKNKQPYSEFKTINLANKSDLVIKKDLKYGDYGIKMDELFL